MKFVFTVTVEVERVEGKFASRDEISDAITGWLDDANIGEIDGVGADGESTYEVVDWTVEL